MGLSSFRSGSRFWIPGKFTIIFGAAHSCMAYPGWYFLKGQWGCAAGWGRIFMTGLAIMGSHFQ